MFVHYTFSIM